MMENINVNSSTMPKLLEILKKFKEKVSEKFGNAEVILFGSHARGNPWEESDIDILVILDRDVDMSVREEIYDIAYEFDLEYDVVLDVIVYSRKEWNKQRGIHPLLVNAEKEGITV